MSSIAPLLLLLAGLGSTGSTGSTAAPAAADPGGGWAAPVGPPLVVLRGFAPPQPDRPWLAGHRGVDLAAGPGAPVRSPAAGAVGYAGLLAGRGVVVVLHGAVRSTFEPVRPLVQVGQRVLEGSVLGLVSAVPGHCGVRACVHWGVLDGRLYLDPLRFLAAARGPAQVRLLPLLGAAGGPGGAGFGSLAVRSGSLGVRSGSPGLRSGIPSARASPPGSPPARWPPPGGPPGAAVLATGTLVAGAVAVVGGRRLVRGCCRRVSRAARPASRAAAGPPWCASGRCGTRSPRAPGRSRPASAPRSSRG